VRHLVVKVLSQIANCRNKYIIITITIIKKLRKFYNIPYNIDLTMEV